MSKKKIKLDRRVKKMANNSNWTRNMLRSMGFTTTDLVKDLMPNTTEFAQSNSQVNDIIKDVRRNITNRKVMNAQFKNIPGLKTVDEVFKNIKEDIKSGNLNNKDRENSFGNFGDSDFDFGFDSDMFGGDDVVEFLDDESPVNQPPTIIDTMPLARAINSSTEATVTTMMAVADQQMTIETEKLLFNHRSSNAMLEGLTTINDNLATLVKFNSESTTQYHAASMKFYEEMTKMMEKTVKKDYDDYDWSSVNDVFDSSGNVKISEYINRVKSNIKDKKDESMWGFFLDNLTNPMMIEGMVKNPIGTVTRVLIPGLVNSTVKTAFKQLDESITSIIPAALARINTFDGEMNPTLENIFKIFNAREKLDYDIDLSKYEKGAVQWDGESKKALVEVIPTYLRRIESAITGEKERVYDYDKGNFINIEEVKKRYSDNLSERETSGFLETRMKLEDMMYNLTGDYDSVKTFSEDVLNKYFSTMTKQGYHINHKKRRDSQGNEIDELLDLFDGDSQKADTLRLLLNGLSKKDLRKMATVELNDSMKYTQDYINDILSGKINAGVEYIYNNSYFDKDDIERVKYENKSVFGELHKDRFGLTQLDYLRDIRKALSTGIKVYPQQGSEDTDWNPNIDIISRAEIETANANNVQEEGETQPSGVNTNGFDYNRILNMSQDDINEAINRTNGVRTPRQSRFGLINRISQISNRISQPIANAINPITETSDNLVDLLLFGSNNFDEEGREELRNELLEAINPIRESATGTIESIRNRLSGNPRVRGTGALGEDYEYEIQDYNTRRSPGDRIRQGVGLIGNLANDFMEGFNQFRTTLFGESGLGEGAHETIRDLANSVKERMPKAIKAGIGSAAIKTLFASNLGVLGSILLPGGPIGAALVGMSTSLLTQSETFKRWMFGEMDEDGNRNGGMIPQSLVDMYNEHGKTIKRGAGAGILASFFLPGGPILGAITGIGTGLLAKSDAFQQFIFGDDFEDTENRSLMNGAFGKIFKTLSKDKEGNEGNPKLATFLGGAGLAAGIAQGVGLLPSMLLPGGPIIGSIIGLSTGIAASSDKFQKFLFGEKDEDGKRSGGLVTKFANWFDVNVAERFRVKIAESNDKIYEFLNRKILFPIQDALSPIKQLGLNVLEDIKDAFKETTEPIVESFKENVTRPLGKWMKKHFMDPITKAIKGTMKFIGKTIANVLLSPIKLLTGVGNIADKINERRALKEEKKNRRAQFKEEIREKGFAGLISGAKKLKITDEEKQKILTTGKMQYRADREKERNEREEKLQAEMEERRSKTEELNRQFEEDMAFGKGSGWKLGSKRQQEKKEKQMKEKQRWLQEKATTETVEMNSRIKIIKDLLSDNLDVNDEQTDTLHGIKDLLYKLVTGKDPVSNDISENRDFRGDSTPSESNDNVGPEIVADDGSNIPGMNDNGRKGAFKSLINTLRNSGRSHKDGLDEVPHDSYVAELHEGEMIIPKSPAGKVRDMFEDNAISSKMTKWFDKKEEAERIDRRDNALGLTDEEAAQIKEINDRKRYSDVSKKGVDYIMKQREEEQKEKEERQWRSSILTAIESLGNKIGSGAKKSFDLFGTLGKLLGNMPNFLSSLLKGLGITGILAGLTQLLGAQQFKDYYNKAEENNDSILDVYQGEHREERLDADGTYVYDNQLISAGQKMIRPGTMKALLKPEMVLYDKMVKPAVEYGGKAIDSAKKIGGKVVDYFNPNITKTGTTALGESYKFTMRKPDPTAGQKMMGKVLDGANNVKAKSKGLFDEFMTLCKKALQIVADKFTEKFPKLASSKVVSSLDNVMGSLAKYSDDIIKKFGKKIAVFIGDVALDFVPVVGQVTEICCTAYDVLTGLTAGNAGNMFGVPASHVDNEMRVICSLLQGLCKFSAMAVLWILNEISTSFLGVDVIQMLARFIYKILPVNLGKKVDLSDQLSGVKIEDMSMEEAMKAAGITYLGVDALYEDRTTGKLKDLSKIKLNDLQGTGISSTELQELARHQYNLENGTQLDSAAWNDKTNKTFGAKIMDSAWGRNIRGITTAQNLGLDSTANVSLLDRFMNSKATTGTAIVNLAGKLTGNENWKNKTVNDTLAKYAEWRNNRYNNKMTKIEEKIAEKEAKGKDTTKLHKKLDKLKGKLGLSDSEYEELKASKNSGQMTGDAGMGEGEEFNPDKQKIVEVFNEDGTLSHCITVPIKETTEVEGFSSSEILKPVSEYNTNKMQGIPQYDEKGNLVSYTTVDKRKTKTGGLFSKITSAVGGLFGFGNGSSTTDNSVDNSSSVTNNTGDTYNTTNEIDTTPFAPLTEAINSLVGINKEENVDDDGNVKTGRLLDAILHPISYFNKQLVNAGVNVVESVTGEEVEPEKINKAINFLNIIRNPLGYLADITKGYLEGDKEDVNAVNTAKEKTKEAFVNGKNWVEGKLSIAKEWGKEKIDAGKEWFDKEKQRSYETAAIMAGDKNTKANVLSTGVSNAGKLSAGIYNLFAGEGNEITSGEMTDAIATFINKAIVTPFKELANPAADKFNEVKESISDWVTEKKENIANWYTEEFKPGLEESKASAKKTQQAIIDDVNATKERISNWYTENIGKPLEKSKASAKKTQQAIFDDVKARKDALMDWYTEKIGKPLEKSTAAAKKTQQAIFDDVKARKDAIMDWITTEFKKKIGNIKKTGEAISGWVQGFKDKIVETFNKYLKDPVSDALSPVTSAISGAWSSFKSAFEPFAKVFDAIKGEGSITDIIKSFGQEGRENAGLSGIEGSGSTRAIRPKKYRATESDFITPTNNTTNNTTNSNTNNKFVFYNQSDSRWAQNKLGNKKMKDSGCGPTSLAMAISQLTGEQITPDTIARLGKEHLPGFSKYSLFPSVAEKLNMNYNEGYDERFIIDNLQQGIPVILSGRTDLNGTPYTSEGHVVTATKIKGDSIFINDPRGKEYSGYYPISSILKGLNKGMTVSPSNRTDVKGLSSGHLLNGWNGKEYEDLNGNTLGIFGDVGEYKQLDDISGGTGAAQITMADRVLSYARAFLNNTSKFSYSQPRRLQIDTNKSSSKGCGADCSSFVSHVLSRAGDVNIYGTTSQTFWDSVGTKVDEPQIGDVVCQQGHVGLYSGDGNYIHMSGRKAGIKESKAIQSGNNKHRGYKRVLKNPSQLVDPTVPNPNTFLGTVVGTPSGQPVGGGTPSGPQASLDKALLIGDSLTVGMKPVLEGKYPSAKAMGKGGKWAKHWLESLSELPDASSVSTVIQWLGINGVHDNKNNIKNSQELLTKLKEKYPNVPIFNMDIFPTTEDYSYGNYTGEWWRGLSQEFNKEMGTWAGANGITQINATNGFIQEDGFLDPSKAVDGIHFNTDGYKGVLNNIESNLSTYNSNRNTQNLSGGTSAPQADMLGVFGKLSSIATGMVASIFNGKDMIDQFLNGGTTPTDGTTPTNGSNPDISGISDNASAVWKFFTGKGYTPEATAGILGNMTQESGVDPTAIQGGGKGPAAGICQWENYNKKSARWKAMSDYAASKGKDWKDLQSQLEWLDLELQGKDSTTLSLLKKKVGGYEQFKSMTDVKQATKVFEESFERAGKPNMPRRYSAAENYYNQFKSSGNLDISAGTGPATATTAETYTGDTIPTSLNGWAYYKQGDPQWQEDINGKKIGPSGCGMASHAMMLTTMFGKQITPVTVGKWARAKGHWSNGMGWGMPGAIANLFGLDQPYVLQKDGGASNSDLENVKAEIKAGRPVVLSGRGKSGDLNSPFTGGGHIVLAVGVDGNNRLIINDPRGMEYTKAYEDSGVMDIGTGLRGAWSFDLTSNSKVPDDWTTGGDFTPGSVIGTPADGTVPADGTTGSTADMLGIFGQLSNIATNYVSSIFNGKDMFSVQTTPTDGTTPGVNLPGGDFIGKVSAKYEVSYPSNRGDHISDGASWGDPGGTSYGLPQFATNTGSAKSFAQWLSGKVDTNLGSLTPNTSDYNTEWKAIPGKIGMDKFEQLQGQYAFDLLGKPFGDKWLAATGLTMKNRGFQEMLYSAGIQHGSGTAKKYATGISSNMSDTEVVDKFYDNRGELNSTKGSVKTALKKRFASEREDIKALLNSPTASTSGMTGDAGNGEGDGKVHWAKGFDGNKSNKVNYTKGHAGMGEGNISTDLVNTRRNMERNLREIDRNMNVVNNTTNINNPGVNDACIKILKVMLQELQSINNNTAETANNINNIEIVSPNTPVGNTQINNKHKNDINHSNPKTGYDIARKIASYK